MHGGDGDREGLALESTRRERIPSEIVRQLKTAILSGRLKTGQRLPSEKMLAHQFQSSRGSVREAIRSLEHAGLLRVRPGFGGGAFVADGDLRHVTDSLSVLIRLGGVSAHHLTEARLILEPRVAALAARRITGEELSRITAHTAAHAVAIEKGHFHATADLGFHRLIAEASRNPVLVLVINAIADLMVQEVVARLAMDEATNTSNLRFHKRIVAALRRRDSEGASRVMLAHVRETRQRLAKLMAREE